MAMPSMFNCTISKNSDMVITYECVGIEAINIAREIKLPLLLKIYGGLTPMIKTPTYFYTLGDPVLCVASRISSNVAENIEIMLPTRLSYSTPPTTTKDTQIDFDPTQELLWTPRIPLYPATNYRVCCLSYDVITQFVRCDNPRDIIIITNYTFKYNYDIASVFLYPGNVIRCCILTQSPIDPTKWIGDTTLNCLTAMIIYYANTNRGTTPENPGDIVAEGTQVIVPDLYAFKDITLAASFVKCYTESYRQVSDLKKSARQLKIQSCTLSPPPLMMLPNDQTLFLVNNTITCIPNSEECKSTLLFNFNVYRGGILIDTLNSTTSIVLINRYMGKNIRVTCESGQSKASKDISIERVPHSLQILGLQRIMTINSVITCSSDGFPDPHIVWTQTNGSSLLQVDDYAIIIRNWDRSGNYEFTCTAFNKHGESSQNIKFQLFNVNMRDTYFSMEFYIIIYFELFLYHCLLLIIVYFLFRDYLYESRYPNK